jgi:hypothetical protein
MSLDLELADAEVTISLRSVPWTSHPMPKGPEGPSGCCRVCAHEPGLKLSMLSS